MAAEPDGKAPGPIEKVTIWVLEASTLDDKDKPKATSSTFKAKTSKTSVPSLAAGAAVTGHAG